MPPTSAKAARRAFLGAAAPHMPRRRVGGRPRDGRLGTAGYGAGPLPKSASRSASRPKYLPKRSGGSCRSKETTKSRSLAWGRSPPPPRSRTGPASRRRGVGRAPRPPPSCLPPEGSRDHPTTKHPFSDTVSSAPRKALAERLLAPPFRNPFFDGAGLHDCGLVCRPSQEAHETSTPKTTACATFLAGAVLRTWGPTRPFGGFAATPTSDPRGTGYVY